MNRQRAEAKQLDHKDRNDHFLKTTGDRENTPAHIVDRRRREVFGRPKTNRIDKTTPTTVEVTVIQMLS